MTTYANWWVFPELDTATLIAAEKMLPHCEDIVATLYDSSARLYRRINPDTENTATTEIQVKIPSLPEGDTEFYLYYGNPDIEDEASPHDFGTQQDPVESIFQLDDLTSDIFSQYVLLAGRSGGQEIFGSNTTSEDLTLTDNSIDNNSTTVTEMIAAHTHISNNGTDHSYIDQDLTTTATPSFAAIITAIDTQATSDPPSDAELDALYTGPGTVGSGWTKLLLNSNSSTLYFIVSDGSNWYQSVFALCI